jgi:DNA sulfur modification protein DndB
MKNQYVPGYLSGNTDKKTIDRARKVFNGYFKAIMDANPTRWVAGREEWICVNPGIRAHFMLINDILKHLEIKGKIDPYVETEDRLVEQLMGFISPILQFVKTASLPGLASRFSRKFGEGGVKEYYFNLCEILNKKHNDFGSEEFKSYISRQRDAETSQTRQNVLDLAQAIMDTTIDMLKDLYGANETPSGEKAYWEFGIENTQIKSDAYKKQQMEPVNKRLPKEAYLELIDCEKSFRQQGNWPEFQKVFNIPMPSVNPKSKTYHLDWLVKLNEIRRVAAHGSSIRGFSPEDIEFTGWLKKELYNRLEQTGRLPDTA